MSTFGESADSLLQNKQTLRKAVSTAFGHEYTLPKRHSALQPTSKGPFTGEESAQETFVANIDQTGRRHLPSVLPQACASGSSCVLPAFPLRQMHDPAAKMVSAMDIHHKEDALHGRPVAREDSLEPGSPMPRELDHQDTIKVAVRVRPLLPYEKEELCGDTIQMHPNDHTSIKVVAYGPLGSAVSRDFQFHACLGQETSQPDVMECCGIHQLLDAALNGYNVTIMAYGQTGSGKTYTMSGKCSTQHCEQGLDQGEENEGVVERAVRYLVSSMANRNQTAFSLKASYLEIYNEGVYDLIHSRAKSLPVKWDARRGFHVPGLKVVDASTIDSLKGVIAKGLERRRVGSHELNVESSRSHTILTIYCESADTDPANRGFGSRKFGKVSFVDLAGSERLKDSCSTGQVLKETTNINKSLFTLGKVISALAERDSSPDSTTHIPYRDSVLTKLLMDSLGGSSFALMIACCSPAQVHVEETFSTLCYATRAKRIVNRPAIQYDPHQVELVTLRSEIELLREENLHLKHVLSGQGLENCGDRLPFCRKSNGMHTLGFDGSGSPPKDCLDQWQSDTYNKAAKAYYPRTPQQDPFQTLFGTRTQMTGNTGLRRAGSAPSEWGPHSNVLQVRHSSHDHRPPEPNEPVGRGISSSWSRPPNLGGDTGLNRDQLRGRLQDTQGLLDQFAEENSTLARENERLRTGGQQRGSRDESLLEEIGFLKRKLSQLESTVLTSQRCSIFRNEYSPETRTDNVGQSVVGTRRAQPRDMLFANKETEEADDPNAPTFPSRRHCDLATCSNCEDNKGERSRDPLPGCSEVGIGYCGGPGAQTISTSKCAAAPSCENGLEPAWLTSEGHSGTDSIFDNASNKGSGMAGRTHRTNLTGGHPCLRNTDQGCEKDGGMQNFQRPSPDKERHSDCSPVGALHRPAKDKMPSTVPSAQPNKQQPTARAATTRVSRRPKNESERIIVANEDSLSLLLATGASSHERTVEHLTRKEKLKDPHDGQWLRAQEFQQGVPMFVHGVGNHDDHPSCYSRHANPPIELNQYIPAHYPPHLPEGDVMHLGMQPNGWLPSSAKQNIFAHPNLSRVPQDMDRESRRTPDLPSYPPMHVHQALSDQYAVKMRQGQRDTVEPRDLRLPFGTRPPGQAFHPPKPLSDPQNLGYVACERSYSSKERQSGNRM